MLWANVTFLPVYSSYIWTVLSLVFFYYVFKFLGNLLLFDFATSVSVCTEIIIAWRKRGETFYRNFENVRKLTKDAMQLTIIHFFRLRM